MPLALVVFAGICVDGNEQVGLGAVRDGGALFQSHKSISPAACKQSLRRGSSRWINLPSLCATSRHRSFSIRPLGPMLPVSWPPWPGSITMRPIFNPRARVRECSPLRVGCAAGAGPMVSARVLCRFVPGGLSSFRWPLVRL